MNKKKWAIGFFFLFLTSLLIICVVKLGRIDRQLHELARVGKRFSPACVEYYFDPDPRWDVPVSKEVINYVNVVTQQPYHWLAKGFQAFAFESQDGQYVLKFFQQRHLKDRSFSANPIAYLFDSEYRQDMEKAEYHKLKLFTSSKLSFLEIPEESGILYIHLNRTQNQLHSMRLVDQMQQAHKIKGDDAIFILQRKASYIRPTITELMEKGDKADAERRLDQIFDLLLSLAKKKIADSDVALIRNNNLGFVKDRAIYIDTGHLEKRENLNTKEQMQYEFDVRLRPLYDWLKIEHPSLIPYYEKKQQEILHSLS